MNAITVLITGSTDGIGLQTAIELARKGVFVIVHGRNKERAAGAETAVRKESASVAVAHVVADFTSMDQVAEMAKRIPADFPRLNVLINNAGVYMRKRTTTSDGFEATFAVNHLAHFLLTHRLLALLKRNAPSRIINVSSVAHQRGRIDFNDLQMLRGFDPYDAYAASKLANVLFTVELAQRLSGTQVIVNALHPGVIQTKLLRAGFNAAGASLRQGAETPVYLATSEEGERETGKYFERSRLREPSHASKDRNLQHRLWEESERLLQRWLS